MADAARGTRKGERECGGVPTWHCHEGGGGGGGSKVSGESGMGSRLLPSEPI